MARAAIVRRLCGSGGLLLVVRLLLGRLDSMRMLGLHGSVLLLLLVMLMLRGGVYRRLCGGLLCRHTILLMMLMRGGGALGGGEAERADCGTQGSATRRRQRVAHHCNI